MNPVPKSERTHIAIVGKRNAGKSSLVNAMLGQKLCKTSNVPGTTTDPLKKAMELLPYGPIVLVDTAGIDDEGEFSQKRISQTIKIISSADFAIVVLNAADSLCKEEKQLFQYLNKLSIPFLIAVNKVEFGINPVLLSDLKALNIIHFEISCKENVGIDRLKSKLLRMLPPENTPNLRENLIYPGDVVVLVVPKDPGAPKESLILPQIQAIREALDEGTIVIVTKDRELKTTLALLKYPPNLVVTDSESIKKVAAELPENIKLTTFSILMAHFKGDLNILAGGLKQVEQLNDGDKVLIAEACTHHAKADDMGRLKIPQWLKLHTKKDLIFEVSSGAEFPENLSEYKLIIHCGGCMLTRREMLTRLKETLIIDIPIVNYGVLISYLNGVFPRVLLPFGDAVSSWKKANVY